jgi:hypothetical protein
VLLCDYSFSKLIHTVNILLILLSSDLFSELHVHKSPQLKTIWGILLLLEYDTLPFILYFKHDFGPLPAYSVLPPSILHSSWPPCSRSNKLLYFLFQKYSILCCLVFIQAFSSTVNYLELLFQLCDSFDKILIISFSSVNSFSWEIFFMTNDWFTYKWFS